MLLIYCSIINYLYLQRFLSVENFIPKNIKIIKSKKLTSDRHQFNFHNLTVLKFQHNHHLNLK